jgi:hypothetical protein
VNVVSKTPAAFITGGSAMNGWIWLVCAAISLAGWPRISAASRSHTVVVGPGADLPAVVADADAGTRIHIGAGTYRLGKPLVVPDGVTLEGDGVMLGHDLPDGFAAGTETRLLADAATTPGDLVTLGDGATLRALVIEDIANRPGNVVSVHSRGADDHVTASIEHCEIRDPKLPGAGPDGPLGRALAVLTQNRSLAAFPPPDVDAKVSVSVTHSIVRASGGSSAIFAINFASRGDITVVVRSNRLYGSIEMTGGVSRPDEVIGASLTVRSEGNVYSGAVTAPVAWTIDGGSGAPVPGFVAPGTSGNRVRFSSIGDAIEGFRRLSLRPRGSATTRRLVRTLRTSSTFGSSTFS